MIPYPIEPKDLRPFDTIRLTGTSSRPHPYVDFHCVVATVSRTEDGDRHDDPDAIKVWPMDENDPQCEDNSGKFWFPFETIGSIILLDREG